MSKVLIRGIVPLAVLTVAAFVSDAHSAGVVEELQPLTAAPSAETGVLANESARFWFVEYPSAPLADGNSDAAVDHDHDSFRSEAAAQGVQINERMRFKSLWNGISIEARAGDMARI